MPDVKNLNINLLRAFRRTRADREYICKSRDADGIICYLAGSQHFYFESGEKIDAHASEVLYIPYKSKYRNRVDLPETDYIQIDFIIRGESADNPLFDKPFLIGESESAVCRDLAARVMGGYQKLGGSNFGLFSDLCGLIDAVRTKFMRAFADCASYARIQPSLSHIESRYYENTSIEELAAMSSTCVANLERLYKQCFGVTPGAYRNNVRVNKAKGLLLSGLTVEETARSVGFYDASHFAKTFKRIVGVSPGEYARATV